MFKVNSASVCDPTNYKRIRGQVNSVFPREGGRVSCTLYLASELGLSVMSRTKIKAEDGRAGCLRAHDPVITKVLTYY